MKESSTIMLAKPSDSLAADVKAIKAAAQPATFRWPGRALMLVLNVVPLLLVIGSASLVWVPLGIWPARIGLALAALYWLPPVLARVILLAAPIVPGRIDLGSGAFFRWWAVFQLQVVFCRFPALEEALRLIPGVYSLWLRLWGSRIGGLTYWSPGVVITDRSFLQIGDGVVFGAGVRLNAHVLTGEKAGPRYLLLAPIKIGDHSIVGGYSLLTAGTEVAPGETTLACQLSPPFSYWKEGKRIKRNHGSE